MTIIKATEISSEIDAAIREIFDRLTFTSAPDDGKCPHCGGSEFLLMEFGYERWSQASKDVDDYWLANTHGWDDISQAGIGEILACKGCDASFEPPIDVDWS